MNTEEDERRNAMLTDLEGREWFTSNETVHGPAVITAIIVPNDTHWVYSHPSKDTLPIYDLRGGRFFIPEGGNMSPQKGKAPSFRGYISGFRIP